jgi:hypothetical protein
VGVVGAFDNSTDMVNTLEQVNMRNILENLIQPTISLEMPVPSQGHYVFTVFRLLIDFVCL